MKKYLPTWIPKSSRPAIGSEDQWAWDKLTDNEKRWSFLIDFGAFVVFTALMFLVLVVV